MLAIYQAGNIQYIKNVFCVCLVMVGCLVITVYIMLHVCCKLRCLWLISIFFLVACTLIYMYCLLLLLQFMYCKFNVYTYTQCLCVVKVDVHVLVMLSHVGIVHLQVHVHEVYQP